MTCSVSAARTAEPGIAALRGHDLRAWERFGPDLAARGCAAAGYRLTGDIVDRLCVRHLRGNLRIVIAFASPDEAVILLVERHVEKDPTDVYERLYALAGISVPSQGTRTKPACCEDADPPTFGEAEVQTLVARARALDRRR